MPIISRNFLLLGALVLTGIVIWSSAVKEGSNPINQSELQTLDETTMAQVKVKKEQAIQLLPEPVETLAEDSSTTEDSLIFELEQPAQTWLSQPTNTLSNALYEFIETEQVSYLSTEDVPFSEEQRNAIMALSKDGSMLMFDNTESDYLDSYGLSESEVVSEFFGSAAEGDVILATSVRNEQGGIHYLVLPLQQTDGQSEAEWAETVKSAIELFKEQQEVERNKESFVEG
ncbi:hypothetical protein [Vibrio caribbeanicus]|uniref:hypothetical protein n=1 Tax=Vibrio caribbeanicus TaxID=701175 RepID=UPI002283D9DD|nr:hypothetical protein [Vibrio caribbeanicus]MCY9843141.1 hypothetical protein [Vibrio caribbeanicus]